MTLSNYCIAEIFGGPDGLMEECRSLLLIINPGPCICGFVRGKYTLKPAGPRLGCRLSGLIKFKFAVPGAWLGHHLLVLWVLERSE